jgi:hypothetical protein
MLQIYYPKSIIITNFVWTLIPNYRFENIFPASFALNVTGIINSVFKLNLVKRHTRLRVYNALAKPTLVYRSEAWTVKQDEKWLEAAEMRFMCRTAEYVIWDKKKWTYFGRITSTTNHHLPTAIHSTMEITHWMHDRHQMAKTNNTVLTTREEIIGKTAKTLVWYCNIPPGPQLWWWWFIKHQIVWFLKFLLQILKQNWRGVLCISEDMEVAIFCPPSK